MATQQTTTLSSFYVGWSPDGRSYQLLGLYEAANAKDAVNEASMNHGQSGRYLVMPDDKVTVFQVTFDLIPQMVKVTEEDSVVRTPTDASAP